MQNPLTWRKITDNLPLNLRIRNISLLHWDGSYFFVSCSYKLPKQINMLFNPVTLHQIPLPEMNEPRYMGSLCRFGHKFIVASGGRSAKDN